MKRGLVSRNDLSTGWLSHGLIVHVRGEPCRHCLAPPNQINQHDRVVLLPAYGIDGIDDFSRFWINPNGGDIIAGVLDLHFPYDFVVSLLQSSFDHGPGLDRVGLDDCLVPGHGLLDIAADLGEQDDAIF